MKLDVEINDAALADMDWAMIQVLVPLHLAPGSNQDDLVEQAYQMANELAPTVMGAMPLESHLQIFHYDDASGLAVGVVSWDVKRSDPNRS